MNLMSWLQCVNSVGTDLGWLLFDSSLLGQDRLITTELEPVRGFDLHNLFVPLCIGRLSQINFDPVKKAKLDNSKTSYIK